MIGVNVSIHIKYAIPATKNMMPPIHDHFHERIRIATTINAGIKSPKSRTNPVKKIHKILGIHGRRRSKKVMITFTIGSVKS